MELNFYTTDNIQYIGHSTDIATLKTLAQQHHTEPDLLLWYRLGDGKVAGIATYYERTEVHLSQECENGSYYKIE